MNKLLLTTICCAVISNANAQASYSGASANGAENSATSSAEEMTTVSRQDLFYNTSFSVKDNMLSFAGLPADKRIRVYITNSEGQEEYSKKLSAEGKAIDVKRLGKGLHYITLISKDDKRKAFMVHL